jgi:hypothetical protein
MRGSRLNISTVALVYCFSFDVGKNGCDRATNRDCSFGKNHRERVTKIEYVVVCFVVWMSDDGRIHKLKCNGKFQAR